MKKFSLIILTAVIAFTLFSCDKNGKEDKRITVDISNGYTIAQEVLPFKFSKDEKEMKNNDNVVREGFKTSEKNPDGAVSTKTDAINIAKKDVKSDFNKINVYFDRTQGIWKVVFSTDTETDEKGKFDNKISETVYVDEDGYTLAIKTE